MELPTKGFDVIPQVVLFKSTVVRSGLFSFSHDTKNSNNKVAVTLRMFFFIYKIFLYNNQFLYQRIRERILYKMLTYAQHARMLQSRAYECN